MVGFIGINQKHMHVDNSEKSLNLVLNLFAYNSLRYLHRGDGITQ